MNDTPPMPMKELLRHGMLFARLDDVQLERVARRAVRVPLQDGEALFEQGDPAERFYLMLEGQIKLFRLSPAGNEKVIEVVTPYSTFAEALMFLERPSYPVGAQALGPAAVLSVDGIDFLDMLKGSAATCLLLLGDMSQRLRGLLREIDELSLHSATCRVAAYLDAQPPPDAGSFDLSVPKQTLASRLSIKPETFSRIIKSLNDQQIIRIDGNHVEILDRDRLRQAADVCALPQDALRETFMYAGPPAETD